jgi:hypothetical protein
VIYLYFDRFAQRFSRRRMRFATSRVEHTVSAD